MAETPTGREDLLRREYHGQTARIRWHELQTHYARGSVVCVDASLDLVEVAVQLGMDNAAQFSDWMARGKISGVSEAQALAWYEADALLWAVVAAPWVLVQSRPGGKEATTGPHG